MTLGQLKAFAAVARNGSVRGAARELGVSEPAVSLAVAALRRELGDALYAREGRAVALTAGGRRLAALASEITGLAEQAQRSVREAQGGPALLHVAATDLVAERVAPPLLEAFSERTPNFEAAVEVEPSRRFADLLRRRRADIALGPRPAPDGGGPALVALPFLRYRLVVVAAPGHRLAGRRDVAPAALARERWLVGPAGADPATPPGELFAHAGIAPADVRVFPSDAAMLDAAGAGEGVALALAHTVRDEVRRRALVRLDVRGTPRTGLWFATTLGPGSALPAALALQRFATTPSATHAVAGPSHGVPAARMRPFTHVTLWRGVTREGPAGAVG